MRPLRCLPHRHRSTPGLSAGTTRESSPAPTPTAVGRAGAFTPKLPGHERAKALIGPRYRVRRPGAERVNEWPTRRRTRSISVMAALGLSTVSITHTQTTTASNDPSAKGRSCTDATARGSCKSAARASIWGGRSTGTGRSPGSAKARRRTGHPYQRRRQGRVRLPSPRRADDRAQHGCFCRGTSDPEHQRPTTTDRI